jgi:uncharacterized protein with GYD domain
MYEFLGETAMATFITNIKFTQQGIKGIDETTTRAFTAAEMDKILVNVHE